MKTCTILILAALLLPAQALAYLAHAKTVRDGDSIAAYGPEDALVNLRLYGIDAPEYKQPYGLQAKKRLSKLLGKREFQVEPQDTDRYGRTVALLRLPDGTLVNEVLVAEGAAWVYDQYCREADLCQRLRELQDKARVERRGLWAEDNPTPPWNWRKEHKTEEWYKAPVRAVKRLTHKVKVVLHR
jgi:endonuclease YncB( thermonuclease family)